LQQGIGLIVVDVVTARTANLHRELCLRLSPQNSDDFDAELYAVGYRLVQREGQPSLDIWQQPLAIGAVLPTVPLWLRGGLCIPVELEISYERTCREQRIRANGA
jgi:hypothetical protein